MENKYLIENKQLVSEFNYIKNNIDINLVRRCSNQKIWWICSKGHEWKVSPNDRNRGTGCPMCSGRVSTPENNLVTKRPDLVAEWHPTKNLIPPTEYLSSSGRKVWWMCIKGHEWEATIDHRNRGRKCPFCQGTKVTPERNLAVIFPEIAAEWHPTKNLPLTPQTIMPVTGKNIWWLCPKGHEYQLKVSERTNAKRSCPHCGKLADDRPEIAAEWHPTKNFPLTPSDVYTGTSKKVYWLCSVFPNHVWKASICSRTGWKNSGCPMCRSSKGEKRVGSILEELKINYKTQLKLNNCKNQRCLPFDFAVFNKNQKMGLIEFHGEQHYRVVPYWGGQKKFNQLQKNDLIKKEFCEKEGIKLLVIPYNKTKNLQERILEFSESL